MLDSLPLRHRAALAALLFLTALVAGAWLSARWLAAADVRVQVSGVAAGAILGLLLGALVLRPRRQSLPAGGPGDAARPLP